MFNEKPSQPAHPILEVIVRRWSPYAFDNEKPLPEDTVKTLLEAARWAPSSFNEQPWSYVVGHKGDETHRKLAECLSEGNSWAREVEVLMLSVAGLNFKRNGNPNPHAMHDLGCASGYMFLQATDMGIAMHEMAGFDHEKARELFKIGPDFKPGAMIAIGYPGDPTDLPVGLQDAEKTPRQRKTVEEMVWRS